VARNILQITSYPPPRAGWGVRVQFLKKHLEAQGHRCVVLNIGTSRAIPSDEYETVLGAIDYISKVWRFCRRGFVVHMHVNGTSPKGFALAIAAQVISLATGRRPVLTFHGGVDQVYFPRPKAPLLLPVFRLLFGVPRWIICNNEAVKEKIVEYGVRPGKVVPIAAFSHQYLEQSSEALPNELEAFYQRFEHVVFSYMKMRPVFYPQPTVEGFARLARQRQDVGLVLCGVLGNMEPGIWPAVQARIEQPDLRGRVLVVDDLSHELFLNALGRASVCLRSPPSDGVCSSVLEALSLGVPVVASENHHRPPGVITYDVENVEELARVLGNVLDRRDEIAARLPRPEVRDTLSDEVELLTAC
jgi:glycosyltransferase involved in cell wall biosynthesis